MRPSARSWGPLSPRASSVSRHFPAEARAQYLAGSLLSFIQWWLDNDRPHTPDEMAAMYAAFTADV